MVDGVSACNVGIGPTFQGCGGSSSSRRSRAGLVWLLLVDVVVGCPSGTAGLPGTCPDGLISLFIILPCPARSPPRGAPLASQDVRTRWRAGAAVSLGIFTFEVAFALGSCGLCKRKKKICGGKGSRDALLYRR